MMTRYFALAAGVVYALVGGWGLVFGSFPDDVVVNLVGVGLGAWGIMAFSSRPAARAYAQRLAVAAGVLAFIALLPPGPRTTLGFARAFDLFWLHAATVVLATYFGWGRRRQTAAYEKNRLRRAA
jgi:hypothetical protein